MSANLKVVPIAPEPKETEALVNLFAFPECTFTSVELIIPRGMKFERWQELGAALRAAGKGVQFWIGDWVRFGEHEYGEMYAQAIEATGKELSTLQNYVYVAQNVHSSRRRELDLVDFSTHAEVASLPPEEQERILSKAAAESSTRREVRREVHKVKRKMGKEKTEIQVLQEPAVHDFLTTYADSLRDWERIIPPAAPFLKNMVHAHIGQVQWQLERTIENDCDTIMLMFEDGTDTATDNDIFQWLQERGYFMRDPELDDRLELMCANKQLRKLKQGGRKENQPGDMPDVYAPFGRPWAD